MPDPPLEISLKSAFPRVKVAGRKNGLAAGTGPSRHGTGGLRDPTASAAPALSSPRLDILRQANLRPGRVISEMDGQRVRDERDFESTYAEIAQGKTFLVRGLQPDGRSTMVTALRKPE